MHCNAKRCKVAEVDDDGEWVMMEISMSGNDDDDIRILVIQTGKSNSVRVRTSRPGSKYVRNFN